VCAKFLLATRHFTLVRFVIVACEMKKAMKHQNLDFNSEGMATFAGLPTRDWNADGHIAGNLQGAWLAGWERKHVGGYILATKLPVQAADGGIRRQQNSDLTAQLRSRLRLAEEAGERPRVRNAFVPGLGTLGRSR